MFFRLIRLSVLLSLSELKEKSLIRNDPDKSEFTITKCFGQERSVTLMVFLCLKLKAVAAYLHVEKIKQMEGRQAQYTRSLKPPCHGDEPTRS